MSELLAGEYHFSQEKLQAVARFRASQMERIASYRCGDGFHCQTG
jgi:hypothetical protein